MKSEQQNVFLKGLPDTCLKSLIQQRKYKQFFRNQAEGDMFTKHLSYCYYRWIIFICKWSEHQYWDGWVVLGSFFVCHPEILIFPSFTFG